MTPSLPLSPTVARYLRQRDEEGFRELILELTRPGLSHCRRVLFGCYEILVPVLAKRFPSLGEAEMRDAYWRHVCSMDIPADLDELRAREDSAFDLLVPESEPQGPPQLDLEDRLDGTRPPRTRP